MKKYCINNWLNELIGFNSDVIEKRELGMRAILSLFVIVMVFFFYSCGFQDSYTADVRRKAQEAEEARQKWRKRVEEEKLHKFQIEADRQKRIEEQAQAELDKRTAEENELKRRYFEEYQNNKTYNYITSSKNYDEIIANIRKWGKDSPKVTKAFLNKVTKDNTLLAAVILVDLKKLIQTLGDLLNSAGQNNETTKIIEAERKRLIKMINEVDYDAFTREKNLFLKITGHTFYSTNEDMKYTLASCINDPRWEPEPGYLYSLNYMRAIRTVEDGVLIRIHPSLSLSSNTCFLKTKKDFVDGQSLNGRYANYIGTYKYFSFGQLNNVYGFELFDFRGDQVVNGKEFFFYPRPKIMNIENLEKKFKEEMGVRPKQ